MDYLITVSKLIKYGDTQRYKFIFETKCYFFAEAQRAWKELVSKFPQPEYQIVVNTIKQIYENVNPIEFF